MSAGLPIAETTQRQTKYCTYCPKLCRPACPTALVQAREATTPWGKMTSVGHVHDETLALTPDVTQAWFSCTGCMRCTTYCDHEIGVAQALYDARAGVVGGNESALQRARHGHQRRSTVARKRAQKLLESSVAATPTKSERVLFAGCTALSSRGSDAQAAFRVMKTLGENEPRVEAEACCGFPLLEAGDRAGFEEHMSELVNKLQGSGEVVFLDPGCLHGMRMLLDQSKRNVDFRALHISEFIAERATQMKPVETINTEVLRYHDACHLGRGLGVYEAPRRALSALAGEAPLEFSAQRNRAECSGAGGRFPETHRADSHQIARELESSSQRLSDATLVSCCPGAVAHLRRSAAEPEKVRSFIEVVDHALHGKV